VQKSIGVQRYWLQLLLLAEAKALLSFLLLAEAIKQRKKRSALWLRLSLLAQAKKPMAKAECLCFCQ